MAFEEVQFPSTIQYTSAGGPEWNTEITELNGGTEQRNQIWVNHRHRYTIKSFKQDSDIDQFIAFFNAMRGRLHGFRLKDWGDYRTGSNYSPPGYEDEVLVGDVDGVNKDFQLVKRYSIGSQEYVRYITKPVTGTTRVSLDSVEQMSGWTVDTTTGIVTFSTAPVVSTVVAGGCEFDVPVRFDTDHLDITHSSYQAANNSIPMVELRIP